MTELNAASNRMVLIIDCKVKDIERFKTWSKDRAAKYVYELKEENSISYEWHISEDGSEATLIEAFTDSDAMMVRLGNHAASPLASEVLELVDITDVLCLGNASPSAVEALSAWGARFRSHHSGYNREIVAPR
jgi:quinol monooxygenase YgiN